MRQTRPRAEASRPFPFPPGSLLTDLRPGVGPRACPMQPGPAMKNQRDGQGLSAPWGWRLNDELGGAEDGAWRLATPAREDRRIGDLDGLEDGAGRLVRRAGRPGL